LLYRLRELTVGSEDAKSHWATPFFLHCPLAEKNGYPAGRLGSRHSHGRHGTGAGQLRLVRAAHRALACSAKNAQPLSLNRYGVCRT
jgi:hypothetical protein